MNWFRVYHGIKDETKLLGFPPETRWFYLVCLDIAGQESPRGSLPSLEVMAQLFRLRLDKTKAIVAGFIAAGLIDEDPETKRLRVHGWDKRQRESDNAAVRMARSRAERKARTNGEQTQNMLRNSSEPHVRATDTDTDTDIPPTPLGGVRAVEGEPDESIAKAPAGPPLSPIGSKPYQAVMDAIPDGWKLPAEPIARGFLSWLPAEAVLYGLQETLERFEGPFTRRAIGYWKKVASENPNGRPAVVQARFRQPQAASAPPPAFHRAAPQDRIAAQARRDDAQGDSGEAIAGRLDGSDVQALGASLARSWRAS